MTEKAEETVVEEVAAEPQAETAVEAKAPAASEAPEAPANPLEKTVEVVISAAAVVKDSEKRLRNQARKVRIDGFRRGHVPMNIVRGMYGAECYSDAVNAILGPAVDEALAGQRVVEVLQALPAGQDGDDMKFKVVYEVFPEIVLPDFSTIGFKRFKCEVTQKEVDETIEVMRRQRTTYTDVERASQKDDRVTVDFEGKLDGTAFDGGSATDYGFVLGSGQMLPEFDEAATGMSAGETKAFKLTFPSNYGGKGNLAGKEADFTITMKKVAEPFVPALDEEFCKALGVDGGPEALAKDVESNLRREVKARLLVRTKDNVFNALLNAVKFDVPKSLVAKECQRLEEVNRQQMKSYGVKDEEYQPVDVKILTPHAERNVSLGILANRIIEENAIAATDEGVRALASEMASAYEQPEQVAEWYLKEAKYRAELERTVIENNLVEFILSKGDTAEEVVDFKALMGRA